MNRDEHRSRHETNEIIKVSSGQTDCFYPVDQMSSGTWFGFNNHGVTMALLNRYQENNNVANQSRGIIIPKLLKIRTSDDVIKSIFSLSFKNFEPFDLIITDNNSNNQYSWDGQHISHTIHKSSQPLMYTSSSIDLPFISQYRKGLFNQYLDKNQETNANDIFSGFHLEQNKADTSSSVYMEREAVHTKSICQVVISESELCYRYWTQNHLINNANLENLSLQQISIK